MIYILMNNMKIFISIFIMLALPFLLSVSLLESDIHFQDLKFTSNINNFTLVPQITQILFRSDCFIPNGFEGKQNRQFQNFVSAKIVTKKDSSNLLKPIKQVYKKQKESQNHTFRSQTNKRINQPHFIGRTIRNNPMTRK